MKTEELLEDELVIYGAIAVTTLLVLYYIISTFGLLETGVLLGFFFIIYSALKEKLNE